MNPESAQLPLSTWGRREDAGVPWRIMMMMVMMMVMIMMVMMMMMMTTIFGSATTERMYNHYAGKRRSTQTATLEGAAETPAPPENDGTSRPLCYNHPTLHELSP